MEKIKIVVDTISTDDNLEKIVEGALKSLEENDNLFLYLVGPKDEIQNVITKNNFKNENYEIIDGKDKISNTDNPLRSIRQKTESSLYKSFELLKKEDINALVSAGATGAILCGAILNLKRLGSCQPALSTLLPTQKGDKVCIMDCGANIDCTPMQLVEYAKIGSCYMSSLYPNKDIKVGLLSNGKEDNKGNSLTKQAFQLIKETDVNFIGNIEGTDILTGECDVVVCDGFIGNVVLKNIEGTAKTIIRDLFVMLKKSNDEQEKKYLQKAINELLMKYDLNSLGGATLLGIDKVIIKGHGTANNQTIYHIINDANTLLKNEVINKLDNRLK